MASDPVTPPDPAASPTRRAPSPEERDRVAAIKARIDLADQAAVLQFGAAAQAEVADFADAVLAQVAAKEAGKAGETLQELLLKVKGLDGDSLARGRGWLGRLFGSAQGAVEGFLGRYQKLAGQIDRIVLELEQNKDSLLRDVVTLDLLYARNLENFRALELYLQAGEEKAAEVRAGLPALQQEAEAEAIAAQRLADGRSALDRFDKKLADLRLSRTIVMQTMPQIRLIQNNDAVLVEKIQSSLLNTIPIWKNQMVIALSIARQHGALALQREVTDATNAMLRKNAELLKQGSVETAREAERGIVDIETLQQVNAELISTIDEVLTIQAEGRAARARAEGELVKLEGALKARLAKG